VHSRCRNEAHLFSPQRSDGCVVVVVDVVVVVVEVVVELVVVVISVVVVVVDVVVVVSNSSHTRFSLLSKQHRSPIWE